MKAFLTLLALCSVAAAESITLIPTKDNDVYSFLNRTVGDIQTLNVNSSTGMAHSNHSVVHFNVAASTIPVGEVASAKLRLYSLAIDASGEGGAFRGGNVAVHRQGKTWTESALKWTDLDPQELIGLLPVTKADAWTEVDVTSMVIGWMNGTVNHGFLLRPEVEGADSGMNVQFISRDIVTALAAYRPQLVITRGTPPVTTPPVLAVAQSAGQIIIEWPVAGSTGWTLQETDDLTVPWTTSTATPTETAGKWRVAQTPGTATRRFFRLNKP